MSDNSKNKWVACGMCNSAIEHHVGKIKDYDPKKQYMCFDCGTFVYTALRGN